mgnify:FL=1
MKEWFLGDIPLREFTIVWQSRAVLAERFAKRLFRRIKEEYGIALPLQDDTAPATRQEILIGQTCRTDILLQPHEYVVNATKYRLKIAFESIFGYELAWNFVTDSCFGRERQVLVNGDLFCGSAEELPGERGRCLTRHGDLRVLSNNIFGAGKNSGERMRLLHAVYRAYDPDLLLFQESSPRARRVEDTITSELLRSGWREVRDSEARSDNFNPVFYRASRFRLIDSGYHVFSGANNFASKSLSWAVLSDRKCNRKIGVYSHHFYYTGDELGNRTRLQNVKETAELIGDAERKYGCPFVGGGDINCTADSDPYRLLLQNGFRDSFTESPLRMEIGTCHDLPDEPDSELGIMLPTYDVIREIPRYRKSVIDFVFLRGGLQAKCHGIIADEAMLAGTDHAGVWTDLDYKD